jgi:2-polyprenyl-3-methyl-5-hydroxy-6-metoxy-1,4-benzoquinol methylase
MDSQLEEVKVSHSAPLHRGCDFQLRRLKALANATAYNRWIFSTFVEYLVQRVLEIGCGTGNLTRLLLEKAEEVTAIDIHAAHIKLLATRVRVPDGHNCPSEIRISWKI